MALVTQGITVSIETALAGAKAISAISKATEAVVTATGHGYSDSDIIKITDTSGMFQVNNRAFRVDLVAGSPITNKFGLKGVNSSAYTTYSSGGNCYKATMTGIDGIASIPNLAGGTTPMVDVTTLASFVQEQSPGLAAMGSTTFDMIYNPTDAGQIALFQARENMADKVFTVTLKSGLIACCVAYVNNFTLSAAANNVVRGTCELAVRQGWSLFA